MTINHFGVIQSFATAMEFSFNINVTHFTAKYSKLINIKKKNDSKALLKKASTNKQLRYNAGWLKDSTM